MKQGGLISTWLFSAYIHELIVRLHKSGFGCCMVSIFIGCVFLQMTYRLHLQCVNCSDFSIEYDIKFNPLKSYLLHIGLDANVKLPNLILCNVHIKWSRQIKYLSVHINADKKFNIDTEISRRKFLVSVFSLL